MREFTERGGWWVAAQGVVVGAVVWALLAEGGDWGTLATTVGVALGAAGGVLAVWAMVALGDNLSPYPHPRHGAGLVEKGPYRRARHPVYGGVVVGAAGAGLFDANPVALGATAVLAAVLLAKARFEESRLMEHVPGYAEYRRRVERVMIPWVL